MITSSQVKGAIHLNSQSFDEVMQKSSTPVMVDFFATWCGPCQMAAPIIDKLADEFKDKVLIAKLDVDENHDIAQKHKVMSIPTIIMFNKSANGEYVEVDRLTGFAGDAGYRKMLMAVTQT